MSNSRSEYLGGGWSMDDQKKRAANDSKSYLPRPADPPPQAAVLGRPLVDVDARLERHEVAVTIRDHCGAELVSLNTTKAGARYLAAKLMSAAQAVDNADRVGTGS